ncbi:HVO_0649 family zinc finger protein [Natrialbaceae archaeon AArc-T1-2]|uniref:HVO_0649 family zinc finger protein n=1 Tax=Natrialbaceae archaeon AArc-T1-2 TaxID=3053904 RepID=UPI00255B3D19|nr:HVO_0649 family zinc finger protein [Natrialbaceae archaeon AArc-T1-2]WIV66537.1 hypothetical protein QQ977_12665 [Natrialbaceae archaeon AArc-T1-2]
MAARDGRNGSSPFDRLRQKLDATGFRCRDCGYVDENGSWQAATSGAQVTYQHSCPKCDAVSTRDLRLE